MPLYLLIARFFPCFPLPPCHPPGPPPPHVYKTTHLVSRRRTASHSNSGKTFWWGFVVLFIRRRRAVAESRFKAQAAPPTCIHKQHLKAFIPKTHISFLQRTTLTFISTVFENADYSVLKSVAVVKATDLKVTHNLNDKQ